jgi:tetratricopeptide (TPR) repeat protein
LRRARETGSTDDERQAAQAIATGFNLAPKDFRLRKTQVVLLLQQHAFTQARDQAKELNLHNPDDPAVYGYLAQADIGLGDYHAAVEADQWMLNLQPFNVPGLLIATDLREHTGDAEGALDVLQRAYAETSPEDTDELASISKHISSIETAMGKPETLAAEPAPKAAPAQIQKASLAPVVLLPVPAALLIPQPTATERIVKNMQSRVQRSPKDSTAYSALGAAFFQRARETGDVEDFQLADQALTRSLDLVSTDFSAAAAYSTKAEVCMGEHRFSDAITYAQKALSLGSGDLSPFAIVGDANADMGEYERAAVAYSRLDGAYVRDSRSAYLKFVSGDTMGAIELMQSAVAAGTESRLPAENLAWLYFELGEFEWQSGDVAAANHAYLAALNIHPGDYRALAALGKLRGNQGRYAEAIKLYQSAIAVVPMPVFVAELGDMYKKAGNPAEARKQYQLVEYIGLLGHINQVLHNRDLALFYADHDIKLDEALALARKEFEVRHDIYTWDALAWALYKNGKYQDASDAMDHALRPGTQDALLLFHAGMIAGRLGQTGLAKERLQAALDVNPHFHVLYSSVATQQLKSLQEQSSLTASQGQPHVP